MDLKRQFQHEDDECDDQILVAAQHSKRRREDNSHHQPQTYCIIGNLSMLRIPNDTIVKTLTDSVQRIVREELERGLAQITRPAINESGPSEAATKFYELVFENELPDTIHTLSKIKAKDEDGLVKIALYDNRSGSIVTSGALSSLEVEICAVNDQIFSWGGSSNEEHWTTEQFKANILREMDNNKGKLLKGDLIIQLKNGVCYINIMFTDNSSRTSTRHFRLGAIVHSTSHQAKVKEAISNRFMVKEPSKKRYPPFQNDPIWRLKNISKGGKIYDWLSNELKINTVKDLLHVSETNPSLLQKKNYVAKLKEAVEHAKTCIPEVTHNNLDDMQQQDDIRVMGNPSASTASQSYPTMPLQVAVVGQCSAPPPPPPHLPTTAHQVGQFGLTPFGMSMTELGNTISSSLLDEPADNDFLSFWSS